MKSKDSDAPETVALLSKQQDVESNGNKQGNSGSESQKPYMFGLGLTTIVIGYYALCSSTMLVINKVAIYKLPCPIFVLCCQLFCSAAIVAGANHVGLLQAEVTEWAKLKKFIWVVVGFLGTIFANIKVLQHANVETFITFRSSTPLILSVCDYLFLGRMLPSARSWGALLVLLGGSLGYVMSDSDFRVDAYVWLFLWYCFFTFDTVYVKHMCDTVKMTNWSRVYYTNAIALVPLALSLPILGEHKKLERVQWTPDVVGPLVLSCVVGLCMSHSAYLLRDTVSATLFTIVGILCKIITVVINVLIWDKHATPTGIMFLLVCVLAGTFYEQSPKRSQSNSNSQQQQG
eukprot:XP_001699516.1 solute carrier protein [Chlamydomonas reinhardtii]